MLSSGLTLHRCDGLDEPDHRLPHAHEVHVAWPTDKLPVTKPHNLARHGFGCSPLTCGGVGLSQQTQSTRQQPTLQIVPPEQAREPPVSGLTGLPQVLQARPFGKNESLTHE